MVFQEDAAQGAVRRCHRPLARVGLTSLNGDPAARLLKDSGGSLRSGKAVKSIEVADDRVIGIRLSDGATIRADAYVSALPYGALLDALPGEVARGPFFSKASSLDSAPIVGIHLWYDRPVMESGLRRLPRQPCAVGFQQEPDTRGSRRRWSVRLHLAKRRVELRRLAQG